MSLGAYMHSRISPVVELCALFHYAEGVKSVSLNDITGSTYFSDSVFLDSGYILTSQDIPLTNEVRNRLAAWGFRSVFSEGTPVSEPVLSEEDADEPAGEIVRSFEDEQGKTQAREFFQMNVKFLEEAFARFREREEIRLASFTERVKEIIVELKNNKRFLLSLDDADSPATNYLSTHSVKTAILALALTDHLKWATFKQIDVGLAGLLHEIGLLKIPDELYLTDRKLSQQEKQTLLAHPVLGFRILKGANFPVPACLGVLEHNERIDGSGFPRRLSGDEISQHGRILAVASSYNAATSKRPYKAGIDGHSGLVDLLKDAGKRYDEKVLAALLFSLSLYPIGTYVRMSNGAIGVVVKANDADPMHPLIRLIIDENGNRYAEQPTVQTRIGDDVTIESSISKADLRDITKNK